MVGGGLYTSGFDARHAVVYAHLSFPPAIFRTSLPRSRRTDRRLPVVLHPWSGTSAASSGIGGGGGSGDDDSGSGGGDDDDDGG
jgi:uncharacterized membrane protein YgcG